MDYLSSFRIRMPHTNENITIGEIILLLPALKNHDIHSLHFYLCSYDFIYHIRNISLSGSSLLIIQTSYSGTYYFDIETHQLIQHDTLGYKESIHYKPLTNLCYAYLHKWDKPIELGIKSRINEKIISIKLYSYTDVLPAFRCVRSNLRHDCFSKSIFQLIRLFPNFENRHHLLREIFEFAYILDQKIRSYTLSDTNIIRIISEYS